VNAGSTGVNAGSTDVLVRIEREARKDLRLRRSTLRKGSTFPASLYFLEMLRLRLNIRRRSRRLSQNGNSEPRLTAMCGGQAAHENPN